MRTIITPKIQNAIDYTLFWEDEKDTGEVTEDRGGKTRFGIAQKWHPELTDANYYNQPKEIAVRIAAQVYANEYASRVRVDDITDIRVGAKIHDMYVNMGVEGLYLAQRAVQTIEDGGVGPQTLMLWNSASPDRLLWRLATLSVARYSSLEGSKEEHEDWFRRGSCLGQLGTNLEPLHRKAQQNGGQQKDAVLVP